MIEFDVDMGYLLEDDELDCVILNDENGEHKPMEFVPKLGNGTCEIALARLVDVAAKVDIDTCAEILECVEAIRKAVKR